MPYTNYNKEAEINNLKDITFVYYLFSKQFPYIIKQSNLQSCLSICK